MTRNGLSVGAMILLASCVAPPAPVPSPTPRPPAPPPPPPAPPPSADEWHYAPLTPGTWSYRPDGGGSSTAAFGPAGTAPALILRCDRGAGQIVLGWPGALPAGGNRATITTSYGGRTLTGMGTPPLPQGYVGVGVGARDPLLDQMAFSRGRLMVAIGWPAQTLILPAWPEISRVIEDCRK